jgi:hypothetical protein
VSVHRHFSPGTILALVSNAVLEGLVMNENNPSDVRVSNWTQATGTRPGERDVYPSVRQDIAPRPVPETRPWAARLGLPVRKTV